MDLEKLKRDLEIDEGRLMREIERAEKRLADLKEALARLRGARDTVNYISERWQQTQAQTPVP